ncbi:MAG: class I SAM-dependent methyltransferase [Spirochaetaceae bacterium]|nr:class I SAM-dependent methyltransferase [Spirochaetaceae bacterium]MBO7486628.1 class I SAM-dependent methyltransferase [Spirochaetaceae bacterium]MBP5329221.1 class I SAM-dependent methyltransferase [Spirochaetaceae bacterium]
MKAGKKQWFEKEKFWLEFAPIMFDANHWAEATDVAEAVYRICGLKNGDSVLDAGCGVGRISVELALLGLNVTGVDLIQPLLDTAKESAMAEGVSINLVNADLRSFSSMEKFDAAVSLYTSFGYCDTEDEDSLILSNIASSLKPGGKFIMECLSREIEARDFIEGEWFERAGKTVLTDFSVVNDWKGLRSRWILIDNKTGERYEHEFVQRLYSAPELKTQMLKCGFKTAELYGDFDFSPYDYKARTMIIVAEV